jgi:hypothetical protein
MNMATGFDCRHPRGVILTRVLVTAWLLALTGILLAYGYWRCACDARRRSGKPRMGLSRLPGGNALDPGVNKLPSLMALSHTDESRPDSGRLFSLPAC